MKEDRMKVAAERGRQNLREARNWPRLSSFEEMCPRKENGASEGIRTLDIHVGNVTLYQTELRSLLKHPKTKEFIRICKP